MPDKSSIKKILEFKVIHKYKEFELLHNQEVYKLIKIDSNIRVFIEVKDINGTKSFKELLEEEKIKLLKDKKIKNELDVHLNVEQGLSGIDIREIADNNGTSIEERRLNRGRTSPTEVTGGGDDGCTEDEFGSPSSAVGPTVGPSCI